MGNKKKSVMKLIILVVSIAVTILTALIVCRILMVRAYRAHKDQVIHEIDYSSYVQAMGGSIDWNQELEPVIDPDFVPDDRRVTMRLAYYNYENGCTLTLEELKSQFAISKTETEGIDDLIAYSQFINKEGISEGKDEKYENCESCCYQILINNGIDPDGATLEQLTDAFNKAIIVENYMLEKGYGHYQKCGNREELIDEALAAYEEEQSGK